MDDSTADPTADPYASIQRELDAALAAPDPHTARAARERAALKLAHAACSPSFDPRRSRAVAQALRSLPPVLGAPVAPLLTR